MEFHPPGAKSILLGGGIIHAEGVHSDLGHALGHTGLVVPVALGARDGVHHFDAFGNLAEGGVLAVQVGGNLVHDEELAAGGVGSHGAGHGQHAAVMLEVILEVIGGELTLDGVAGAAGAGALGAAALDHKAGDDAVEGQTVVVTLLNQGDKVVDGVWGDFGVQLGLDGAGLGAEVGLHFDFEGDNGILCHGKHSFSYVSLSGISGLHGAVDLTLGVTLGGGLTLVIELFALGKTQLDFDPGVGEIDGQGDESHAVLFDGAVQAHDLALVHEQLTRAAGILVENIALFIGADVHAVDGKLPVLDDAVGVLQVDVALTDGLDLCPHKGDARLELFQNEIVVVSFTVFGDDLDAVACHGGTSFLKGSLHYNMPGPKKQGDGGERCEEEIAFETFLPCCIMGA